MAKKQHKRRKKTIDFKTPLFSSPQLQLIIGTKPLNRIEITKKFWRYLITNKLNDPLHKTMVNADKKLLPIFGGKKRLDMWEMTRLVNRHVSIEPFMHNPSLPIFNTNNIPDVDRNIIVSEGREKNVEKHLRRERNQKIIRLKKILVLQKTGKLACEVCGFDFSKKYPGIGDGFCEVHHDKAIASRGKKNLSTSLDDLSVLCSNCHRMIHRTDPMLSVAQFRKKFI